MAKLKVHLSDPGIRTNEEDLVLVVSVECGGKHGVVEIPFGVIAVRGTLFPKESPEEILKRVLRDKIEDWAREQGLLLKEVTLKVTERLLGVLKGIKEVEVGQMIYDRRERPGGVGASPNKPGGGVPDPRSEAVPPVPSTAGRR